MERTSRPIRIAVDISIWLFQVQAGRGGTNPELRTLFYRLLKFLALPVHPLFVYDGKEKPPFKRGKAVSGHSYGNAPIIRLSKILIDLFKFPRHDAPGEAEAECAKLQTAGVVDAVMSNDVDALMFGSTLAVMNFSKESGSSASGATHVTRYQTQDQASPSKAGLDRAGMILFAMLSGGDYLPSGVPKCGSKLAAEIAKAGFGQDLLEALDLHGPELDVRLSEWRERLQYELEENESGYFQTKHKAVRIPETFPDRTLLSFYAKPIVSTPGDIRTLENRLVGAWDKEVDAMEIRRFAAQTFDWNYRSGARKVIKLLAEPLVSFRLRTGRQPSAFPPGMSLASDHGASMLQKVYKSRTSFSTDGLSELQLDMVPIDVVGLDLLAEEPNPPLSTPITSQEAAEVNEEDDDPEMPAEQGPQSPTKKRVTKRFDPYSPEKVWIFEAIAEIGIPEAVRKWKREQADKATAVKKTSNRKAGPRKKGPLDPGMKHGSILKYGTLTKEKSEISRPPMPTPPKSSPSVFHSFQGSQSSSLGFSSRQMDVQPTPIVERQHPIFDELDDLFSSFSGISPNRNIKRHPMASRRFGGADVAISSGDTGVDALEASIGELSLDSPAPRMVKMSYSNATYQSPEPEPDTEHVPISPFSRERRKLLGKAFIDLDEPPEVRELEDSMKSLSLAYPDIFGTPPKTSPLTTHPISDSPNCQPPNSAITEPRVDIIASKCTPTDPRRRRKCPTDDMEPKAQVFPTKQKESDEPPTPKTCEDSRPKPKVKKESSTLRTIQDSQESAQLLDSAPYNDALALEADPDTLEAHDIPAEDTKKRRNTKKKRSRPSIVDLT